MGPRAGLNGRKISSLPGFDPGPSSPQSVAIPTELPGLSNKHMYDSVNDNQSIKLYLIVTIPQVQAYAAYRYYPSALCYVGRVAQSVQRLTTGWTVRDRIPVGTRFSARPDRPWGPPSLLSNGYRVFPGGKVRPGRAADHSPPSSAAVQEEQSYTSTHPLGHTGPVMGTTLPFYCVTCHNRI